MMRRGIVFPTPCHPCLVGDIAVPFEPYRWPGRIIAGLSLSVSYLCDRQQYDRSSEQHQHRPAAATKATASKAAGAAGVRHVVTGFSFTLSTVGTAQAVLLNIDIIDGATGGTTRLWSGSIGGLPINSQHTFGLTGLMLIGTAATALTIEFSAAGVAASVEQVNLWGFSVS